MINNFKEEFGHEFIFTQHNFLASVLQNLKFCCKNCCFKINVGQKEDYMMKL